MTRKIVGQRNAKGWGKSLLLSLVIAFAIDIVHATNDQQLFWNLDQILEKKAEVYALSDAPHASKPIRHISKQELLSLGDVIRRIERAATLSVEVFLTEGESANAFAIPIDGRNVVLLNFPMLDLIGTDHDAMAAVIAHEVAHLKERHVEKQLKKERQTQAGYLLASVIAGVILGSEGISEQWIYEGVDSIIRQMTIGGLLQYSRESEIEADTFGVRYAADAGFNPNGAIRLWQDMIRYEGEGVTSWLSTHPSHVDRIGTLRSEIANLYKEWDARVDELSAQPSIDLREETETHVRLVGAPYLVIHDNKKRSTKSFEGVKCKMGDGRIEVVLPVHCIRQKGTVLAN